MAIGSSTRGRRLSIGVIALMVAGIAAAQERLEAIRQQDRLAFFQDYEWTRKAPAADDGYRVRLTNTRELGGAVAIGRSFDARSADTDLAPFFTGLNGWDPVDGVIRFLSFNRDGLMVEGTIVLTDPLTIQYDYTFAYPGNQRKLEGRDIMRFDAEKTEFTWTFAMRREPGGELEQYAELEMARGKRVP